jgi:hypothetical protein
MSTGDPAKQPSILGIKVGPTIWLEWSSETFHSQNGPGITMRICQSQLVHCSHQWVLLWKTIYLWLWMLKQWLKIWGGDCEADSHNTEQTKTDRCHVWLPSKSRWFQQHFQYCPLGCLPNCRGLKHHSWQTEMIITYLHCAWDVQK